MRSGWKSQARRILAPVVLVAAVLTPAWPVSQAASQAPATTPGAKADPTILGTIAFRHLSVFSRGGRVTAVAGVPANQQLYYMGSTGGGVWRTTDAGATWTNISDGFFEAGSIGALAVAESESQHHLRRHRLRLPARQHLARHRHLQVERRRQDVAAHRPARCRHDRPHPGPSDQSRSRLRRPSSAISSRRTRSAASIARATAARPGSTSTPSATARAPSTCRWT